MVHGLPDWGLEGPKSTTFGLDDLGEQAVRLDSIHMWDRRGDTILLDSFNHGLAQARLGLNGLNADIVLEGGKAWHGAFCAKLTTGSDDERWASLQYFHGPCRGSRIGIEFTFTSFEPSNGGVPSTAYWEWRLYQQTLTGWQMGTVRWDLKDETLEYQDDVGNWQEFAEDVRFLRSDLVWNVGKLVIDYVSLDYIRFILNNEWWDLSAYQIYRWGGGADPYMVWEARLSGQDNENQTGYVDSVIITQNEP